MLFINCQLCCRTVEIQDVWTGAELPTEFRPTDAPVAQVLPECTFGPRRILAERPCQRRVRAFHDRNRPAPHLTSPLWGEELPGGLYKLIHLFVRADADAPEIAYAVGVPPPDQNASFA